MRALSFLSLPALLLAAASMPFATDDPHAAIRATAVVLDPARPRLEKLGKLRFVRGWVLTSGNARFGGLSALAAWRGRLLGLSDTGVAFSFTPTRNGMRQPFIRPLPGLGARRRKIDRDTESLTIDPVSGRLWVATETNNEVWRFAPDFARVEAVARPPAMRDWPINGGAEAMVRLADGRFFLVAEQQEGRAPGTREALLFPDDPTRGAVPRRLTYRLPEGCLPSDAAALPDGRVLVLNRCFSLRHGFAALLVRVDPSAGARGGVLTGEPIARFARPITLDNLEAVAVAPAQGGVRLWIASDDNFSVVQRTLLLEFTLPD